MKEMVYREKPRAQQDLRITIEEKFAQNDILNSARKFVVVSLADLPDA